MPPWSDQHFTPPHPHSRHAPVRLNVQSTVHERRSIKRNAPDRPSVARGNRPAMKIHPTDNQPARSNRPGNQPADTESLLNERRFPLIDCPPPARGNLRPSVSICGQTRGRRGVTHYPICAHLCPICAICGQTRGGVGLDRHSRGSPSPRVAMIPRWTSLVPPSIVLATERM